jgi:hypothetical protein
MSHRLPLAAVLLIAALPSVGSTQPTGVFARRVLVKNVVPDNDARNRVVVVARDPAIVVPTPGTFQDPRCGGLPPGFESAKVTVIGTGLYTAQLLCDNWSLVGSETSPRGYRYKDPELDQSAVRSIVWKAGSLKMVLTGRGPAELNVDLTPGTPLLTPLEVTLFVFSGSYGYCVLCGPSGGFDGSDGKTFRGRNCPGPSFCVMSPSGAFLE